MQNSVNSSSSSIYPSKVVCVGRNYVEHIQELNSEVPDHAVIFLKPNSAITNTIKLDANEEIHFEAELCLLVKEGKYVEIGVGLDLTKRDLQRKLKAKGLPWERSKAFDGSAVFSEFIALDHELSSYRFELSINGVLTQQGDTSLMIYSPEYLLDEIGTFMSFTNGDILMTGTPKGVGKINHNDLFEVRLYCHDALVLKTSWRASM